MTYLCLGWLMRRHLAQPIGEGVEPTALSTEGKLALAGLLGAALALIVSSAFGFPLGTPTCAAALLVLLVLSARNRTIPASVARGVSWSVLPLVAGLFVIVEAMQKAGMLQAGLAGMRFLATFPPWAAKTVSAFAVALASNGMNNLPVALISRAAIRDGHEPGILAHAILLGVDLGPNLSVTGSLATILWLIALRRENVEITAGEFFRIGLIVMPLSLLASLFLLRS